MERNMKNHSTALRTWVILKDDARARQKKTILQRTLSMSMLAAGMIAFNAESGLIMRPLLSLFFLMYTQIFLVTSAGF